MATFFGEVLSVYSRAVEEDEEDRDENEEDQQIRSELDQKREVHIEWSSDIKQLLANSNDKTLQCSNFIIAAGPNAAGFLSAYVLSSGNWAAVGSVSLWNERSTGLSEETCGPLQGDLSCPIYRWRDCPSVLICQCTAYIAEDQLFQWAEKVLTCIEKRGLNVMVLSDCSVTDFKTPDFLFNSVTPFLRALKTTTYQQQLSCPLLEQPNMVTGLPAAVLSHCQVHQIPAVLYQCYTDVICPDSITMETYKPALSNLSKLVKLDSCPSTEILRKLIKVSEAQSNMYT